MLCAQAPLCYLLCAKIAYFPLITKFLGDNYCNRFKTYIVRNFVISYVFVIHFLVSSNYFYHSIACFWSSECTLFMMGFILFLCCITWFLHSFLMAVSWFWGMMNGKWGCFRVVRSNPICPRVRAMVRPSAANWLLSWNNKVLVNSLLWKHLAPNVLSTNRKKTQTEGFLLAIQAPMAFPPHLLGIPILFA